MNIKDVMERLNPIELQKVLETVWSDDHDAGAIQIENIRMVNGRKEVQVFDSGTGTRKTLEV